ncbi:rho GTPase-activating protein gacF-like isoform X2 [Panonychus citri]|uniref:rho GTPase-activating protein gacF-like isoform X2 n=1 Tax=Panonychus citri TaxID=50023 RepID=UPI002307C8DF|nr:rho GTPase-activating protein gacF-like isoform X2 [Panonychus citri]
MKWTLVKLCLFTWVIKLTVRVSITWPLPSLPLHHVHPYPISWPSSSSSESHSPHHPFSRMSPGLAAVASSVDHPLHHHSHHPDPTSEPLPSGLFIPADQVHIYDFVNNYADDGYYDYDDEDSFQEKVRKWRENHHHHHQHLQRQQKQQQQRSRIGTQYQSRYNDDQNIWLNSKKSTNNKDKQLEGSSSGLDNVAKNPDPLSSNNNKDDNGKDKPVEFDDDNNNNRSSKDDSSPVSSSSSSSSTSPSTERKEITPGEAKDIESLLQKSEIITGRSSISPPSSSSLPSSPPKTLPVEVSRHTITSPNGDMTVVTEMVYKNPYKPTPLPAYSHPPYLPSSRDGLYSPTDDPRLLHHQPSPLSPSTPSLPPPSTPSLDTFGLGRTATYLPPPRSSRNRDIMSTTPWTNGLGRVLPTPPTPFISSTLPTRTSPVTQSSNKSPTKQLTNNNQNSSLNKKSFKQSESNSISKRHEISERSLSAAAIAGIIIGSLVFLALLAGVALFIMYRRPTLPGTTRLRRSTEWVEPQPNHGGGVPIGGGGGNGGVITVCPPCEAIPVNTGHFSRTQRPMNKIHRWPPRCR